MIPLKRFLSLFLILAVLAAMAGCASGSDLPAQTTAAPTEGPKLITNIDDLLAAIEPDAEILLAEGEFDLTKASSYGSRTTSPYYSWSSLGGSDYELQLHEVTNLRIQGCGQEKTSIVTAPRSANVLTLRDCTGVTLEGMTLGHTPEMTGACEGGVLNLDTCANTTLKDLGLFGCGSLGLQAYESTGVTMQDCTVYSCSAGGIQLSQTQDVTVNACTFHSLGDEMPAASIFGISGGSGITVSNCTISNNYVGQLIYSTADNGLTFRDNQFSGNTVAEAAFTFWTEGAVLENNLFENNQLRIWYAATTFPAVDLAGNPVSFEDPAAETSAAVPADPIPVSSGEQTEVRVKNIEEFLSAIAPDTCIILEADLMDLSAAKSYQNAQKHFEDASGEFTPTYSEASAPYYRWVDNFDGPSLVISDLSNLTIKAEGEDRTAHTLSASPRYANVLTFENCAAITLEGFTAGHTIEPGYCLGGVFQFLNCEDVLINNCGMFGCGTMGVDGLNSRNIQVTNSEIYECSVCAVQLTSCEDVSIAGTLIRDIGDDTWGPSPFFRFYDSQNITLDGQYLDGNYVGN